MNVDFQEIADSMTYLIASSTIGRNRRDQHDHAVPSKEIRNISNTANILVSVFFTEAQAFTEVLANDIAIQALDAVTACHKLAVDRSA